MPWLCLVLLTGCVVQDAKPPWTVEQLRAQQAQDPNAFTTSSIVLVNVQRVLDVDLPPADRLASLAVVEQLDADDPVQQRRLAAVLPEGRNPTELRSAVLKLLVRKDYPDLGPYVVGAMSNVRDDSLKTALLDWLARHPAPEVLAEVIKLWAADEKADPIGEARYRRVVESMTRMNWLDALIDALNKPAFLARGSTMELLATRTDLSQLRQRIAGLTPRTEAVEALQYYIRQMDYLPAGRNELLAAVVVYHQAGKSLLEDARLMADGCARPTDISLTCGTSTCSAGCIPTRCGSCPRGRTCWPP